jgi:imidazole glycerol-phosphate synthase subunit HisH
MIAIVDYGLGNIRAFANIYKKLNIPYNIVTEPDGLEKATKIILPGVGAFDHAMSQLDKSGMREPLDELVRLHKIPILGVCIGMHMLAHSSEEGSLPGLGWIDGVVKKFDSSVLIQQTHLPHMGWNDVVPVKPDKLFDKLEKQATFYFLHSFYFVCSNEDNVIAVTEYGKKFACAVNNQNVFGIQFHPEKSHKYGIQLLENFANI